MNQPLLSFDGWRLTVALLLKLIAYPAIAILFAKSLRHFLRRALNARANLAPTAQNPVSTIAYYVVLWVGLMIAVAETGLNLSSVTVLTGAIGLGLGFGMQDIARNFISGVLLLVARPIKPSDWITIGDLEGRVVEIAMYSTTIRTLEDANVVVPNSVLLNNQLINWTLDKQIRRVSIPLGVAYASDMDAVTKLLLKCATDCPDVIDSPEPTVQMAEFGSSSVNFNLVVWTANLCNNPALLKSNLNYSIWLATKDAGIELPFTQVDVRIRGWSD